MTGPQTSISTSEQLVAAFGPAVSAEQSADRLASEHIALIEVSPLVILSTSSREGIDSSPRGDLPGFVRIEDDRTLMIPDRARNLRLDALRNIVTDNRVGLLFVIPGSGATLRVSGKASITTDPELLRTFEVDGELPRAVIVVTIASVYHWFSLAMDHAALWNPETYVDPSTLPIRQPSWATRTPDSELDE